MIRMNVMSINSPMMTSTLILLLLSLTSTSTAFSPIVPKISIYRSAVTTELGSTTKTSPSSDDQYYVVAPTPPLNSNTANNINNPRARITLTRYLNNVVKEQPELRPLQSLFLSLQMACKTISNLVNRAGLVYGDYDRSRMEADEEIYQQDGRFYSMKRLDQLSTNVLRNALRFTGKVHLVAPVSTTEEVAEHQPGVLIASALDSNYVAVLDPMDGSGNADASICTGTVFGIFEQDDDDDDDDKEDGDSVAVLDGNNNDDKTEQETLLKAVLQPGKNMRAAGYCLYSSATVLVFTLGDKVMGFTLDPQLNEFVLTHPNLTIPQRGNVYSCNEANSEGWDASFQDYLKALKTGKNQSKTRYAHRYVGSMVGDIHRTLLYGGIFCYPRDSGLHPRGNLQLLYKSAPMAFLVTAAGGKSLNQDGVDLLSVHPERVHTKSPCFIGSPLDVDELNTYLSKDNNGKDGSDDDNDDEPEK